MKKALAFIALLLGLIAPASAMYRCIAEGRTTFQELPCPTGAVEKEILDRRSPAAALPAPVDAAPSARAAADEDLSANMESERLRTEAQYALQAKIAQLDRHRLVCERTNGVTFSRGGADNRSLTGATYVQSDVAGANAAAVRCIAKANELQQEVGKLRQTCAMRRCE